MTMTHSSVRAPKSFDKINDKLMIYGVVFRGPLLLVKCIDSPYTKQLIIEKQYNTISQYLLFSPSSFLFIRFGISTRKCSILNSFVYIVIRHVFKNIHIKMTMKPV